MLFLFIRLAFGTWWDFKDDEFPEIVANSFNKPLFHLCYSRYCPHCHGLPEGFSNYNKTLGDRDDIFISMTDCAVDRGCGYFQIHGTPSIKLVMGKKVRYWADTGERGPNGWNRFINQRIGPNLRRISSEKELQEAKEEPKDGGSTFFLEVPSEENDWFKRLKYLSQVFRIYNDTFVYNVTKTVRSPRLRVFRSKYCEKSYRGSKFGIAKFLESNKFGVLHRYDQEEYQDLMKSKKAAIYVVQKDISNEQKSSLVDLSKDHCDDGIEFGWANVDDRDSQILKYIRASQLELPLLHAINIRSHKTNKFKGRLQTATETGFLPKIVPFSTQIKQNKQLLFLVSATCIIWIAAIFYVMYPLFCEQQSNTDMYKLV